MEFTSLVREMDGWSDYRSMLYTLSVNYSLAVLCFIGFLVLYLLTWNSSTKFMAFCNVFLWFCIL